MTVQVQVTKLMIAVTLVHTGKKLEVKGAKNVKGQEDQSQGLKKEAGATEEVPASAGNAQQYSFSRYHCWRMPLQILRH